jgi:hypothetical protein
VTSPGALLFGRYAFPPNQLGYCGPEDHAELLEYVSARHVDQRLVELERRFEGAYPYLRLIAGANGIEDPFDARVVEAYWIGNSLLEKVAPRAFHESLDARFRRRMRDSDWSWLETKLEHAARPHHNFHVFDIYTRAGLMNDERAAIALSTMDSCRISWGRVVAVESGELVVMRAPLILRAGRLDLGDPVPARVTRQAGGKGLIEDVRPGELVSIHWSWACDLLTPTQQGRLEANTAKYLGLANATL